MELGLGLGLVGASVRVGDLGLEAGGDAVLGLEHGGHAHLPAEHAAGGALELGLGFGLGLGLRLRLRLRLRLGLVANPHPNPEEVGSMGDTSVTMPSACLVYHHATLMRVWEFLSVCVLAQTIEASIPYLGTEDVPSRLQASLVRVRVRVVG